MSFQWDGLTWEGAFENKESLNHRAGIYMIWCQNDTQWKVLDVGEAEDIRERIDSHDREPCWKRNCSGTIRYAAHYTSAGPDARRKIESQLRTNNNPTCGER
jgi:hypothetical protein